MALRVAEAVRRLSAPGSAYRMEVDRVMTAPGLPYYKFVGVMSTLDALYADYRAGYVVTLEQAIRGGVFADFLEMGRHSSPRSIASPRQSSQGSRSKNTCGSCAISTASRRRNPMGSSTRRTRSTPSWRRRVPTT
jgi:hypothetical protein